MVSKLQSSGKECGLGKLGTLGNKRFLFLVVIDLGDFSPKCNSNQHCTEISMCTTTDTCH